MADDFPEREHGLHNEGQDYRGRTPQRFFFRSGAELFQDNAYAAKQTVEL